MQRAPSLGPMMNRGQYVRVAAIGSLCQQFLHAVHGHDAQIVSLGAGFDTRFWQLAQTAEAPRLYIELDQPAIVSRNPIAGDDKEEKIGMAPGSDECSGVAPACARPLCTTPVH